MVGTRTRSLRQLVYAALFGALTALGALITIPMQPVSITLQTFFTSWLAYCLALMPEQ